MAKSVFGHAQSVKPRRGFALTGRWALRRFFQIAAASLVALVICSCEEYPPYATGLYPRAAPAGWWHDEGGSGSPKIIVHIGEQKAEFYKGKTLVGETTVSTGKPGFSTPP